MSFVDYGYVSLNKNAKSCAATASNTPVPTECTRLCLRTDWEAASRQIFSLR